MDGQDVLLWLSVVFQALQLFPMRWRTPRTAWPEVAVVARSATAGRIEVRLWLGERFVLVLRKG